MAHFEPEYASYSQWLKTDFEKKKNGIFERLEKKEIIFVISDLMDIELEGAPEKVKNLLFNFSKVPCYNPISYLINFKTLGLRFASASSYFSSS
jgi:hypothetical protein